MKQRIFFIFFLIVSICQLKAQDPKLPVILPPTPEAASITKYAELTGGAYHGGSQASIPLYQIKMGEINLPLSLNYASNGLKVDEIPSRVGLNWSLSAGGVITRIVNGKPDDQSTRLLPSSPLGGGYNAIHYYYDLISEGGGYDAEPDEFRIAAPGLSGKFVIDTGGHIVLIPYSNLRVEVIGEPYYQILVINTEGIKYYFGGTGATEVTTNHNLSGKLSGFTQVNTGFFLRKIELPNRDSITFTYSTIATRNITGLSHAVVEGVGLWSGTPYPTCPQAPCTIGSASFSESVSDVRYNSIYLTSIQSSAGHYVTFSYANRPDSSNDKRLTGITITEDDIYKKYSLTYSDPTDNGAHVMSSYNKRFFLSELKYWGEKLGVASDTAIHRFEYIDINNLPGRLSYSQDDHGYYNGKSNTNLLPSGYGTGNFGGYAVADRSSDGYYAMKGLLRKIIYPTGGNDSIIYEPNSNSGPGVRVRKIISYDNISRSSNYKFYKYTTVNNLSGSSGLPLYALTYTGSAYSSIQNCNDWYNYRVCKSNVLTSNSNASQYYYNSNPYVYSAVLESDDSTFSNGVVEHIYEAEALAGYASMVIGDDILNLPNETYTWHQGYELATNYYDNNLRLIKSVNNYYHEDTAVNKFVKGVVVRQKYDWVEPPLIDSIQQKDIDPWDVAQVLYNSQWIKHDSTIIKEYDPLNHLVTSKTTNYYGTPANILPIRTETLDSKGLVLKEERKYPTDSSAVAPYQRMVEKNMISPVIESRTYRDNNLKQTTKTVYYDFSESVSSGYPIIIKPASIHTALLSSALQARIRFSKYATNGNPVEMSKENDAKVIYIWDYSRNYPIAEVKNADSSSVAYTSFEADGKGGWSFSGTASNHSSSPTGVKGYSLAGGDITRSGLNSGTTYVITYWKRDSSSSVTVNSASGTLLTTKNGWKLYKHEITGTTSLTVSGTAYIDELRQYPKGSFMSTNTYKPLIGLVSQCDINNRISYYEYDALGRLSIIRDDDKNILKKICYNYAGQPENCSVNNEAIWQYAGSWKCKKCVQDSTKYFTDTLEVYQRDVNPSSATYNQYRWFNSGISSQCAAADWQDTGEKRCKTANGVYTGEKEKAQMDMNPCSQTSNSIRWISMGVDSTGCPPGETCGPAECVGEAFKCIDGVCEEGVKVYTSSTGNPDPEAPLNEAFICTYHYEWSDESWSQDYEEFSGYDCMGPPPPPQEIPNPQPLPQPVANPAALPKP